MLDGIVEILVSMNVIHLIVTLLVRHMPGFYYYFFQSLFNRGNNFQN